MKEEEDEKEEEEEREEEGRILHMSGNSHTISLTCPWDVNISIIIT